MCGAVCEHKGHRAPAWLQEILVLPICKAGRSYIMAQQELGVVLRGRLSHFLSNCVFRGFE